jgi:hypothetical protein
VAEESIMRLSFAALAVASVCALAGCEESLVQPQVPARALTAYQGHATELHDDAIEPGAVGLELEPGRSQKGDPMLKARAESSDAIVRVRITTVTRKDEPAGPKWTIGFRTVDRLAGKHQPPTEFAVELSPRAQATGVLRRFEDRLVGMNLTYVAFVRSFARPNAQDGEATDEIHFHLSPDNDDVSATVIEAATLSELR